MRKEAAHMLWRGLSALAAACSAFIGIGQAHARQTPWPEPRLQGQIDWSTPLRAAPGPTPRDVGPRSGLALSRADVPRTALADGFRFVPLRPAAPPTPEHPDADIAAPVRYFQDFEGNDLGPEWTVGALRRMAGFSRFAGPFRTASQTLRVRSDVGESYLLSFNLYVIGSSLAAPEASDALIVRVDGRVMLERRIVDLQRDHMDRHGDHPDLDPRRIGLLIPFFAEDAVTAIEFGLADAGERGGESWGIDDVLVDVAIDTAPGAGPVVAGGSNFAPTGGADAGRSGPQRGLPLGGAGGGGGGGSGGGGGGRGFPNLVNTSLPPFVPDDPMTDPPSPNPPADDDPQADPDPADDPSDPDPPPVPSPGTGLLFALAAARGLRRRRGEPAPRPA